MCLLPSILKKGKPFSPSLLMKRPRAVIILLSFMTSFLQDGWAMLRIVSTFTRVGFNASMSDHEVRRNSKGTPKTHLVELSFH
jgi:hypothetical protein